MSLRTRKILTWLIPSPLLASSFLGMLLKRRWDHAGPPWRNIADDVSMTLIAPGLVCGLPFKSDWAMMGFAGLFWYCVGVSLMGVILLRKKEQNAVAFPAWLSLAWGAFLLLLMWMFRNWDPD